MGLQHDAKNLDMIVEQREQQRLYDGLFEGHEFVLLLEPTGFVIEANDRALEIAGVDRSEIVMKRLWETPWFRESYPDDHQVKEDLQRAVGGDRVERELRVGGAAQTTIVDAAIQPVTDSWDDVEFLYVVGNEITDLERRISVLEAENECLESFVRAVTHDVRNQLAVASGNLELATAESRSSELDAARDSLERAQELIDELSGLVSEGRMIGDRSPVKLAIVAKEAWNHVDTGEASLSIESSIQVNADESRLMELFENLLRNAVEHAGPDVAVRVGTSDEGFFVADDGPGIPDLGEDPFAAGVTSSEDGTGLGLSIVKKVANAHGWEVTAGESADGGARFEILTAPPIDS